MVAILTHVLLFVRYAAKKKYHPLWYLPNGYGLNSNLLLINILWLYALIYVFNAPCCSS